MNFDDDFVSDEFLSDVSTNDDSIKVCDCIEVFQEPDGWKVAEELRPVYAMRKGQDTGAGVADWMMSCDDLSESDTGTSGMSMMSEVQIAEGLTPSLQHMCRPCKCCRRVKCQGIAAMLGNDNKGDDGNPDA
mmetsp:Transcript_7141/g.12085  ORF Transcript_7141/g.12085 Transcript_7141/m.12085 type:complete len:132 (+) Transcript_7141:1-396(+)